MGDRMDSLLAGMAVGFADGVVSSMPANSKIKRVKQACGSCSSGKIRCDNGRPCSRCVQRGLADTCADRAEAMPKESPRASPRARISNGIQACMPCHSAKVACNDSRPCPRCVRLNQQHNCISRPRRRKSKAGELPNTVVRPTQQFVEVPVQVAPKNEFIEANLVGTFLACIDSYSPADIAKLFTHPRKLDSLMTSLVASLSLKDREMIRNSIMTQANPDYKADQSWSSSQTEYPVTFSFSCVNDPTTMTFVPLTSAETEGPVVQFRIDQSEYPFVQYVVVLNKAAEVLFGYSASELNEQVRVLAPESKAFMLNPFWKLFHPRSWKAVAENMLNTLVHRPFSTSFPLCIRRYDGTARDTISRWQTNITDDGVLQNWTVSFDEFISMPTEHVPASNAK